jgi:hypothetical protein
MLKYTKWFVSTSDDWWPIDSDWYKHFDPDWFNEDLKDDPYLKDHKRKKKDYLEDDNDESFYDYDEPFKERGPYDGDWGP